MQSGNRSIVVGWQIPLSSGIYIYGLRFYEIQISKDGTNWYKPETTKTGKVLETDWYNGTGQVRISGVPVCTIITTYRTNAWVTRKTLHTFIE